VEGQYRYVLSRDQKGDLNVFGVDMGAANLISSSAARRYDAVPVSFVDERTLLVAMADPANVPVFSSTRVSQYGFGSTVAGTINLEQFERRQGHTPINTMDPYDD